MYENEISLHVHEQLGFTHDVCTQFVQMCRSAASADTVPAGFMGERTGRKRARTAAMDLARSRSENRMKTINKEASSTVIEVEDVAENSDMGDSDSSEDSVGHSGGDDMMDSFDVAPAVGRQQKQEKKQKMASFKGFGKKS